MSSLFVNGETCRRRVCTPNALHLGEREVRMCGGLWKKLNESEVGNACAVPANSLAPAVERAVCACSQPL